MKTNIKRTTPPPHLEYFTALSMVPLLGGYRCRKLLEHFSDPRLIFQADHRTLASVEGIGPLTAQEICEFDRWDEVNAVLDRTRKLGAHMVPANDPRFRVLLGELYDPPPLLWVLGDPDLIGYPGVAVVGTRRPSMYGIERAGFFAAALVKRGICVVSGLAYGIDAAAHRAAVDAGGKTVAVLGSGVDVIYPRKNAGLARDILDSGGAVISEYPPGTQPDPKHFPVRNRIVSGMTLGTLVIESGRKGGSMITVHSALSQNREVFAIPHSLENGAGAGNNQLLQEGAKLVVTIEDLLEELPPVELSSPPPPKKRSGGWENRKLDELSRRICRLLDTAPRHIDELSLSLEIPSHQLSARLLDLEMQKCIRQKAGKIFEISP